MRHQSKPGATRGYSFELRADGLVVGMPLLGEGKGGVLFHVPYQTPKKQWIQLKVIARGSHLEFYIDGSLFGTTNDLTFLQGGVGLIVKSAHAEFESLVVKSLE